MARVQGTIFRATLAAAAVALAVPATARTAFAQGVPAQAPADARAAYDRGAAAHARGDYRAAASEMARADELAPNPVALKAALDEALLADDPELGMQLVERARARAPGDATLAPSVRDATTRFAARTGRVRIDCGGRACRASVDARPIDVAVPVVVLAGPHRLAIDADGVVTTKDVVVDGNREVDVVFPSASPPKAPSSPSAQPPPPPVPPHSKEPESHGLSSTWFVTALGATALTGILTIASAIDTANDHSTFLTLNCAQGGSPTCETVASAGRYSQTRTDVLATVAGVFGVATIAVAFFVDWHAPPAVKSAALVVGDRTASIRVRF